MSTFTHNGTKIDIEPDGTFKALGPSGVLKAPSLAAIKKKIDKEKPFTAFPALAFSGGLTKKLDAFMVVGVRKSTRSYSNDVFYVCSDGQERMRIYYDTPENRKKLKAYMALVEASEKAYAKAHARRREILSGVVKVAL